MRVLGLDPGSRTGWAIFDNDVYIASGCMTLNEENYKGGGWRYLVFKRKFLDLLTTYQPEALVYELVRRHVGTDAAHIWGGLTAVMKMICEEQQIPYTGYEVKSIKKHFTGTGNASKELMCVTANNKYGTKLDIKAQEDDEADAIGIAEMLYQDILKIKL